MRTQQRGNATLRVLIAIFAIGLASLAYGVGSETAQPDFALLTVSFLFLMGISQVGVVFSAIMRLVAADWAKPYYRLAELSTIAFFPFAIAGFLLIVSLARDDLFYWLHASPDEHLSPWLNFDWLLFRNLFGMLLFYGVSLYYVRLAMKPDLASGGSVDQDLVAKKLYLWSPIVLLSFVVCNTFFAYDFGMMLVPHFHSTVFPIHFWFGNVFAGCAALIVFAVLQRRAADGGSHFGPEQIKSLGMLVTGFTLMWLYFFWAQFFVIWFGNLPHEMEPLWRQMYGHYGPWFWTMMAGCFFVPFVAFLFAIVKRSLLAMTLVALGINLGIWINKYLWVVPALAEDDKPFDQWIDIVLALGLLAGFVATVMILARRWPAYSKWEMSRSG